MLRNYLKIAWKVFGRNRFFTFVSLFGISLTLAILIIVTSFLDQLLSPTYPDKNRNRCLYINEVRFLSEDRESSWSSAATAHLIKDHLSKLKNPIKVGLSGERVATNAFVGNKKLKLQLTFTDEIFWEIQEFNFLEGGPIKKAHIDRQDRVAVINRATRDAYFGKGETALGKTIESGNVSYKVIGVVEGVPVYQLLAYGDVYAPYTLNPKRKEKNYIGDYSCFLLAESKKDFKAIKEEVEALRARLPIPEVAIKNNYKILEFQAQTYEEMITKNLFFSAKNPVVKFYGILTVAFLLFISLPTLNLMNLSISRIMERASEIGVRKAFGATSSTLATQFIIENIILTILGGGIGLILAFGILKTIENSNIIPHATLGINFKVVSIAILLCFIFGFLSGVLPAIRMSKMQIVNAIKGGQL